MKRIEEVVADMKNAKSFQNKTQLLIERIVSYMLHLEYVAYQKSIKKQ